MTLAPTETSLSQVTLPEIRDAPGISPTGGASSDFTTTDVPNSPMRPPKPQNVRSTPRIVFWYSKKQALLLIVSLFVLARLFGSLVPPLQSPDEFNHLKRAYLLSQGEILATTVGDVTGGNVDTGL